MYYERGWEEGGGVEGGKEVSISLFDVVRGEGPCCSAHKQPEDQSVLFINRACSGVLCGGRGNYTCRFSSLQAYPRTTKPNERKNERRKETTH